MKKLVLLTAILLAMVAITLSQKLWYTGYEVKDPHVWARKPHAQ